MSLTVVALGIINFYRSVRWWERESVWWWRPPSPETQHSWLCECLIVAFFFFFFIILCFFFHVHQNTGLVCVWVYIYVFMSVNKDLLAWKQRQAHGHAWWPPGQPSPRCTGPPQCQKRKWEALWRTQALLGRHRCPGCCLSLILTASHPFFFSSLFHSLLVFGSCDKTGVKVQWNDIRFLPSVTLLCEHEPVCVSVWVHVRGNIHCFPQCRTWKLAAMFAI